MTEAERETPRRPLVDTKSFDLAHDFLSEVQGFTDDDVWELAGVLQRACEDACRNVEDREKAARK